MVYRKVCKCGHDEKEHHAVHERGSERVDYHAYCNAEGCECIRFTKRVSEYGF